jgi:hypothetical protein
MTSSCTLASTVHYALLLSHLSCITLVAQDELAVAQLALPLLLVLYFFSLKFSLVPHLLYIVPYSV